MIERLKTIPTLALPLKGRGQNQFHRAGRRLDFMTVRARP
jgi:hypothetical protein